MLYLDDAYVNFSATYSPDFITHKKGVVIMQEVHKNNTFLFAINL